MDDRRSCQAPENRSRRTEARNSAERRAGNFVEWVLEQEQDRRRMGIIVGSE